MWGACRHEVVPLEHQAGLAARAVGAGDPVRACRSAISTASPPGGAAIQSATIAAGSAAAPASDQDSDRHANDACAICAVIAMANAVLVCHPAVVAAAASGGIPVPDHRRRVRPSELGPRRVSAARSSRSPDLDCLMPPGDRRVTRGRSAGNQSKSVRRTSTASADSEFRRKTNAAAALIGLGDRSVFARPLWPPPAPPRLSPAAAPAAIAARRQPAPAPQSPRRRETTPSRFPRSRSRRQSARSRHVAPGPASPPDGAASRRHAAAGPQAQARRRHKTTGSTKPAAPSSRPTGANSYQLSQQALEALPQGANTPLDKVLLQVPGVSQDSAASGELHVRNEHANLQYRINGIMLPDGVGAFGQIIDTGIVGSSRADHRRAAGTIRPAHRRRARHPDQGGRLQQQRQRQRLWRQPRQHHDSRPNMAAPSARPSITSRGAISAATSASKIRRRP